jgi:hypothetical protein
MCAYLLLYIIHSPKRFGSKHNVMIPLFEILQKRLNILLSAHRVLLRVFRDLRKYFCFNAASDTT